MPKTLNKRTQRTARKADREAPKSLWQFFRESPLVGLELKFERKKDTGRDIDLSDTDESLHHHQPDLP
jgi:very-short-patch-repair endonuclease